MPQHTVQQGDCIHSIAAAHGLFWETVWNHGQNSRLRQQRESPSQLMPGDVVFVPERRQGEQSVETEARHRFRRKGVPVKLRLRLVREPEPEAPPPRAQPATQYPLPRDGQDEDPEPTSTQTEDEPRANVPYAIDLGGQIIEGTTDDDGVLEVSLPPRTREARLTIEPGTDDEEVMEIHLGALDPISEVSGVKRRLLNLGLPCGEIDNEENEALSLALRRFQQKQGLEVTGEMNDTTRDRLTDVHGS